MKKIYIGNMSLSTTEGNLEAAFSPLGTVHSVTLIKDRESGISRGFGFVEMDDAQALTAIEKLNGSVIDGQSVKVNEAHPKTERSRFGRTRGFGSTRGY